MYRDSKKPWRRRREGNAGRVKVDNEISIDRKRPKTVKHCTAECSVRRSTKINNDTEQTSLCGFRVVSLVRRHVGLMKMFLIDAKSCENGERSLKTSFYDMFLRKGS